MSATQSNKTILKIGTHVLIWVLLLLFPYLLSHNEAPDFYRLIKFTWIPMGFYAIIFYCNYLYFNDKYLFKEKTMLFIGVNLIMILIFVWLNFEIRELLKMVSEIKPDPLIKKRPKPLSLFIYKDMVSMIIPVVVSIAAKTTEKWTKMEAEKKEHEKEFLRSELQHLKYQLQPHFFFNSLNTIYSLIERSPALAQETVHTLSKLMRYLLYDTDSGKTELLKEVEFMKQYINLMKLRISEKTSVKTDFPENIPHQEVIPLLFISLIENAFKHGISGTDDATLVFKLTLEKDKIKFVTENANFPKTENDKSGSGIGLKNLKKRLELSYPGKHKFISGVENGIFKVLLEIETN